MEVKSLTVILSILFILCVIPSAFATTYSCANCLDCENYLLNSSSSDIVQLSTDITNVDVNCINITSSVDGVTLDCQGYGIISSGANQYGIFVTDSTPDNIAVTYLSVKNCVFNSIDYPVYFGENISVTELLIDNITINDCDYGLEFHNATGIEIRDSTVSGCSTVGMNFVTYIPYEDTSQIRNVLLESNIITNSTIGINIGYGSVKIENASIWNNMITDISDIGLWIGSYDGKGYVGKTDEYGYVANNTITMRDDTGIPLSIGYYSLYNNVNWTTIIWNNFTGNRIHVCGTYTAVVSLLYNFLNMSNSTPIEICSEAPPYYPQYFYLNYSGRIRNAGNYWTNWSGDGLSDTCTDADDNGLCDNTEMNITTGYSDYLPLSQYSLYPPYDQDPPDIYFTYGNGTEPDNTTYIVWRINSTEDLLDLPSTPYSSGCNFTINGTDYAGTIVNSQTETYCYYNETGFTGNDTRCATASAVDQTFNTNTTDDEVCRSVVIQYDVTPPVIYVPDNVSVNYQPYNITVTTNESADYCWWECQSIDNTSLDGSGTSWYGDILPSASQGNFKIEVRCNDSSGNEGYNDSFWLIYDWTAPNQTILLPENTTYYTNDTIYWNVTFSDTYSSVANAMCISTDGNSTYTCEYGTALYSGNTTLSAGFYNWTFRANDTAGNYDWNQLFFTVEEIPVETLGERYPLIEQLALIPVSLIVLVGMSLWFWGEVSTSGAKDKSTIESQAKKLIIGAVGVVVGIIALLTIFTI